MNIIKKHPVHKIGYDFIEPKYIPKGKDEYYLRNEQSRAVRSFEHLTNDQIDVLIKNNNTSDNWSNILVADGFNPSLVKNCEFFGLIRIGKLNAEYHEYHDLRMPVGIYNSKIISCDIGDDVCIDNVGYMSHYIIEKDVMLVNINELICSNKAKFGNGILKDGEEDEKLRIKIEVSNENGGRSIVPYNGMLAGDAFMWSKYRDDKTLLKKFEELTEKKFDKRRGYYGKICTRTVIKSCQSIKDTWIGTDAYIKGANKLKNITINSDAERNSQIGEGCELVNGIVGFGCRIFYGVKAVRFITASHSQLKYGARLINSYLGNNSTISCCEVLNTMIFPAHEQHHNNSFLCAALVMGQSNIAAGATIGSNHNSRSADGEIVAGRGFWPGLCVSLKHNSKFASFTILAKGDYPSELNIRFPFCLVSNDVSKDRLLIIPAYWFMYNMYALARNAQKYNDRDLRTKKTQLIEYDYLAPDTINEIFDALAILEKLTVNQKGEAVVNNWENSKRPTVIAKIPQSVKVFREMIKLYACNKLIDHINDNNYKDFDSFKQSLKYRSRRSKWINIGGQLMQEDVVEQLKSGIKSNKIKSWEEVHNFYQDQGGAYKKNVLQHAYSGLLELLKVKPKDFTPAFFKTLLKEMIATKEWMTEGIHAAREKDYTSPYRKMIYENNKEMTEVLGKLEDNSFINKEKAAFEQLKKDTEKLIRKLKLK
jgi:hypothetical protein